MKPYIKKLIKYFIVNILYYSGILNFYRWHIEKFNKKNRLLVLRFHRILNNGKKDLTGISISADKFEKLIKFCRKHFDIISLQDAIGKLKRNDVFNRMTLAVTFDDGYRDNFLRAYPILKKYNIPATIFLTAGQINGRNSFWWDRKEMQKHALDEADIEMLRWDEIGLMNNGLINFGSHTFTHPFLTGTLPEELKKEIWESKVFLEKKLNSAVKFFTYPHGDFNTRVKNRVMGSGYEAAFTTQDTRDTHDLFSLGRKGLNEEIISDIFDRFSKSLTLFALLKNARQ